MSSRGANGWRSMLLGRRDGTGEVLRLTPERMGQLIGCVDAGLTIAADSWGEDSPDARQLQRLLDDLKRAAG